ncbi:MAG TPA: FMN-binding glutamate synthase family protein [Candidatus Nanoarchaeia archaeon]|nr:FMN-binding glutamate synthase family protein [Candidatus Nanoarchaeia archaeon]
MKSGFNFKNISTGIQVALPLGAAALGLSDHYTAAGVVGSLAVADSYLRYGQKKHTILQNFGLFGGLRYALESLGPELRQYFFASDTEERPFSRRIRSYVYRLAKNEPIKTVAFGTLEDLVDRPMILQSLFPKSSKDVEPFSLTFGEERNLSTSYTITHPVMISGMSYGALGDRAVRALSKGAKIAGVPMSTGEGGLSEYHLSGGCDIIYQMGTAKFGVANSDQSLNDDKLREIASNNNVKMIEIKFSQGAKPGAGGFLPKEKVTPKLAKTRGIPLGQDVISPPRQIECDNYENTIKFIDRVQRVSGLPTGIKMCYGRDDEFQGLVDEMTRQGVFPDYIAIDGAEGGTGAAPQDFIDDVGMPIAVGLKRADYILKNKGVRNRTKIIASGKLVTPAEQFKALAEGADAVYTGRGPLLALGCIQALECNKGTCPTGITTHDEHLQRGLDVDVKGQRVGNYFNNIRSGLDHLLMATGKRSYRELSQEDVYDPKNS